MVRGKYSQAIKKAQRCMGCGVLCMNYDTLIEHEKWCSSYQEHVELMRELPNQKE